MCKMALLIPMLVIAAGGVVGLGFARAAYASTAPTISTTAQPTSTSVGGQIADKATVTGSVAIGGFSCPPQDSLGFTLGPGSTENTDPIFCSYPAVPGENPNDFSCSYSATTGALVQDNDAGLCPTTAVNGGGGTTAHPTGTVTFNLYNNATATGPVLFTD